MAIQAAEPEASPHPARVTMGDIEELGNRLDALTESAKRFAFDQAETKPSPRFNATQLAALCGKSPDAMMRLLEKAGEKRLSNGLPAGAQAESSNKPRAFSLAEARAWVRELGGGTRPPTANGATITVSNFKGGVGKTVVSMCVAQGLSLKGYSVLCIDLDPQGSLTSLFGISPSNVQESETVMPLMVPRNFPYASDTLQHVIQSTYWDGIDLIPSSHSLFSGEFYLPTRQMQAQAPKAQEPDFAFYEVLNKALDQGLRQHYDYIIIDTPPALSYMTMTTFWAADALLLPLPPEGIDFASSAQFWTMLSDLASGTTKGAGQSKEYAWVGTVASKVDHQKAHTKDMLKLMKAGYRDLLMSTEIPEAAAVNGAGMKLHTVYDISKYSGNKKTLARAREAFDKLVEEVDFLTQTTMWKSRVMGATQELGNE